MPLPSAESEESFLPNTPSFISKTFTGFNNRYINLNSELSQKNRADAELFLTYGVSGGIMMYMGSLYFFRIRDI